MTRILARETHNPNRLAIPNMAQIDIIVVLGTRHNGTSVAAIAKPLILRWDQPSW